MNKMIHFEGGLKGKLIFFGKNIQIDKNEISFELYLIKLSSDQF